MTRSARNQNPRRFSDLRGFFRPTILERKSPTAPMKLKLPQIVCLTAWLASPAVAQESPPDARLPKPPDKEKLSYALGMNLGLQLKNAGIDANAEIVSQAINDVLAGKTTEIQESDIAQILKAAEAAGHFRLSSKNIAEGEAFLAKNAKADGVQVLPDGLQYRVVKEGAGPLPRVVQILTVRFKGTWINGTEFQHNDALEIPLWACPKGLREALQKMKVGSRWQIFVPYSLAFGHPGEQATGYGSTLIYDMELLNAEAENAHPNQHHGAGRLGHTLDEDLLPPKFRPGSDH